QEIQEVAKLVPADRYIVETDSPYLAPIPHRGQSNEPSFVRHTAEKVSELRGISLEQLGAETTANFGRLFSKSGIK
ncbi:LuxR family transcriptional regulator, partial [bacterium]